MFRIDHPPTGDGERRLLQHAAVGREQDGAPLTECDEHRAGAARCMRWAVM